METEDALETAQDNTADCPADIEAGFTVNELIIGPEEEEEAIVSVACAVVCEQLPLTQLCAVSV